MGWKDVRRTGVALADGQWIDLALERETDPAAVAGQLPANHWYDLVLRRLDDESQREELVRQCTYCHQQGSYHTRKLRDRAERIVMELAGVDQNEAARLLDDSEGDVAAAVARASSAGPRAR